MGLFDNLFKAKPTNVEQAGEDVGNAATPPPPTPAQPTSIGDAPVEEETISPGGEKREGPVPRRAYSPRSLGQVVAPLKPANTERRSAERRIRLSSEEPSGQPTEVHLTLDDLLPRLPPQVLTPGPHDGGRDLRFRVEDLSADIARGKAEVPLSRIAEQCPDIFSVPITPQNEQAIRLPLQKLVEQIGFLPGQPPPPPAPHPMPPAPAAEPPPAPKSSIIWPKPQPPIADKALDDAVASIAVAENPALAAQLPVEPQRVEPPPAQAVDVAPLLAHEEEEPTPASAPASVEEPVPLNMSVPEAIQAPPPAIAEPMPDEATLTASTLEPIEPLPAAVEPPPVEAPASHEPEPADALERVAATVKELLRKVSTPPAPVPEPAVSMDVESLVISGSGISPEEDAALPFAIHAEPESPAAVSAQPPLEVEVVAELPVVPESVTITLPAVDSEPSPGNGTPLLAESMAASVAMRVESPSVSLAAGEPSGAPAISVQPAPMPFPVRLAPPPLRGNSEFAPESFSAPPPRPTAPVPVEPPVLTPPSFPMQPPSGVVETRTAIEPQPAPPPPEPPRSPLLPVRMIAPPVLRPMVAPPPLFGTSNAEQPAYAVASVAPMPMPEAAPEPPPPPPPPPLDLALVRVTLDLGNGATLADIAGALAHQPGLAACLLNVRHESAESGGIPEGFTAEAVRALAERLRPALVEDSLAAQHLTVFTEHGCISVFAREQATLCALHPTRAFLPGVRERLAAAVAALAHA